MVSWPGPLIDHEAQTNQLDLDSHKLNALCCRILHLLPPANMLWPVTPNRSRAAVREGMVCHYRNMSSDDHIP